MIEFDDELVGDNFKGGLRRFVEDRVPTGGFLRAVLANDFMEAMAHAHITLGSRELAALAGFILTHVPEDARGSYEKVDAWTSRKAKES